MKKILSILCLCLSLTLVAKTQDTIKIPTPVAKQIAKDLLTGDSAKAELTLIKNQLILTEQKVLLKDNIINLHIQKDTLYENRIKNEESKFQIQGIYVSKLEKDNKKLKTNNKFIKIVSAAIIGGLIYLYIKKK